MSRLTQAMCGIFLVLAAHALPGQAAEEPWTKVTLPAARQLDLRASRSGHRYRVFVAVPAMAAPTPGYPVIYVLDGNAAFPVAALLARSVADRSKITGHVPPIVVGIGYPGDADFDVVARKRDYTVSTAKTVADAGEGGADLLLDFIEGEVKPLLAAHYPIDKKRQALFGHSFGGLFVLHTLFTRPASFSTYLASSPSIWWQNKQVLSELPGLSLIPAGYQPRVQISVGALEDQLPKGNYSPEQQSMRAQRPMVSEARSLAERLQKLPGWAGNVVYHELAGENHGQVWLPAMSRGMQFFLEQP